MPSQEGGVQTFANGIVIGSVSSLRRSNNGVIGDKINLFGSTTTDSDFGIGVQASKLVLFLPSGSAVCVNTTATSGAASSGATGVALFPSGYIQCANIQFNLGVQSKSAAYTALATDRLVLVDASGGARTITLPAVAAGLMITVKKTDSSANAVTVSRAGTATIDGATTKSLAAQYNSISLMSDGTNWFVVGTT